MITQQTFNDIAAQISAATHSQFDIIATKSVAGGDINNAFILQGSKQHYFVKLNRASLLEMFAAEFEGLNAISSTNTIRTPRPILFGQANQSSFLVLEYIEFTRMTATAQRTLGEQLAHLHQQKQPYFGWIRDNTIGSTPQINTRVSNWATFWREHRLGFQLRRAAENGYNGKLQYLGEKLCARVDDFFTHYTPTPSLLHGDLWGGNIACDTQQRPLIYDPACYFGDRETDLAMTELFGGFGVDFYSAYNSVWTLDAGYQTRKTLYNLYHILNHVNLFGAGYERQAQQMMEQLLSA
jgi:protein-ribulosamine 3-kinase